MGLTFVDPFPFHGKVLQTLNLHVRANKFALPCRFNVCDPVGIQTQDLQNRNLTLYSAKLRGRNVCFQAMSACSVFAKIRYINGFRTISPIYFCHSVFTKPFIGLAEMVIAEETGIGGKW